MIKLLLLLLLITPVNAEELITKSHCDELLDVMREMPEYIKEHNALQVYDRCLSSN